MRDCLLRDRGSLQRISCLLGIKKLSEAGAPREILVSDDEHVEVCCGLAESENLVVIGDPIRDFDCTGRDLSKWQIRSCIELLGNGEPTASWCGISRGGGAYLIDSMQNVTALHKAGGYVVSATENIPGICTGVAYVWVDLSEVVYRESAAKYPRKTLIGLALSNVAQRTAGLTG